MPSRLVATSLLLLHLLGRTHGFAPLPALNPRGHVNLKSSNDDGIDAMRRMLEGSWNTNLMGAVPSSPEAAAEAAGESNL